MGSPAGDVWEYFEQWEHFCTDNSLHPDTSFERMCSALAESEDKRGRIFGRLVISDRAFLSVSELVVIENDHAYRKEYSYYLIIEGLAVWGYDRDPTHDPPDHGHGEDHAWLDTGTVTFKQVVDHAWETVTEREAF